MSVRYATRKSWLDVNNLISSLGHVLHLRRYDLFTGYNGNVKWDYIWCKLVLKTELIISDDIVCASVQWPNVGPCKFCTAGGAVFRGRYSLNGLKMLDVFMQMLHFEYWQKKWRQIVRFDDGQWKKLKGAKKSDSTTAGKKCSGA